MRPGQIQLNEFELAIIESLAQQWPAVRPLIGQLHVLSRKFTGVGSFTNFRCEASASKLGDDKLCLDAVISMPNVDHGLGAVLFCENGRPKFLDIFTFGDEHWDGIYDGFFIVADE